MKATDCFQCAELRRLLTQAEEAQAELATQLAGREHQLRRAGQDYVRVERRLKLLEEGPQEDPDVAPHVTRLLNLWVELHEKGSGTVTEAGGLRASQVRKMLKVYSRKAARGTDKRTKFVYAAERLENAIRGCTLNDLAMGRLNKTNGVAYNDIAKHILRDEETVERFEKQWINRKPSSGQGVGGGAVGSRPTVRELTPEDFDGLREAGQNQWTARCPAHDDRNASLSISLGRDGRLLVHCHTGCTAADIAAAKGVTVQSLFPVEPVPVRAIAPAKPVEPLPERAEQNVRLYVTMLPRNFALVDKIKERRGWTVPTLRKLEVGWDRVKRRFTFPIRDKNGTLVNVVRYVPGGSPKSLGIPGRPRDLFPAPESIASGDVWLVEGEPDAVSGHELGLNAVSVPGVNGWRADHPARFRGCDVVVLFDCDDEGRKAAQRVASSLVPYVKSVRVIDLDPKRDDKYDLGDAHMAGVTADDLRKLAAEAPFIERLSEAA